MKIGIIGAMEKEVELLKTKVSNRKDEEIAGCYFHSGQLEGQDVVLVKSGIGKVNAAISTALLLHKYEPDVVINTGSAGGFNPELQVGDLVISNEVRYNDVDATVFGYEYGQVPQLPAKYEADTELVQIAKECADHGTVKAIEGLIVSGDSFMSDETKVDFLRTTFTEPQCAEMEAGAIAQVCYRFNVPFVIIRALSDIAGKEAKESYDQFLEKAALHSAELVINMTKQLKRNTMA